MYDRWCSGIGQRGYGRGAVGCCLQRDVPADRLDGADAGIIRAAVVEGQIEVQRRLVLTGDEYQNLELVIDKGDHYLSGRIRDETGKIPQRAMVTLDKTFYEGPVRYHQYRSQATGNTVARTFPSVRPV